MKVSISWLKNYVPIEMTVADLAEALTMAGLEVDSVQNRYEFLETVRVARIETVEPHPNADKLKIVGIHSGGASAYPFQFHRGKRPSVPAAGASTMMMTCALRRADDASGDLRRRSASSRGITSWVLSAASVRITRTAIRRRARRLPVSAG